MTVKEFLKPNRRKIVLTVILIIWFFIGSLMMIFTESSLNPILTVIFLPGFILSLPIFSLLGPFSPFLFFINSLAGNFASIIDLIFLIVLVGIYSYLISCLIFWIYDFSKKKLKKIEYEQHKQKEIVEKKGFLVEWEEKHKLATKIIATIALILGFFGSGVTILEAVIIITIILIVYLILKLRSKKKTDSL